MTQTKKAPDWERIEASFRAGAMSLREIAAEHGLSEGAIRKRAKRDSWERDLREKVRTKADALVRTELVRSEVRTESAIASEKQTVEVEAQVQARIRLDHRRDIQRFRALCLSMLAELEAETANIELFRELGEMLRKEDDRGQDRRNDLYQKVISSAGRIDSLKKLSETLKHLIGLEREAYGIATAEDLGGKGGDDLNATLAKLIEKLPG